MYVNACKEFVENAKESVQLVDFWAALMKKVEYKPNDILFLQSKEDPNNVKLAKYFRDG